MCMKCMWDVWDLVVYGDVDVHYVYKYEQYLEEVFNILWNTWVIDWIMKYEWDSLKKLDSFSHDMFYKFWILLK